MLLKGGVAWRELVRVWSDVVQPDDEEADTVWTSAIFLRVHMGF
jgi:hypothetical protein